jgi:hypothetical protein
LALAAALAGLAVAGCGRAPGGDIASGRLAWGSGPWGTVSPAGNVPPAGQPAAAAQATPAATGRVALGVYTPGEAGSWAAVAAFGKQAGVPISYVVDYLGPGDPFPAQLAQQAAASGAEMVLQLEPKMSMSRVAAGNDDHYLDSLAAQVADFAAPVILSWAAEANGNWYSYGATRTPVSEYRAAWAHVMSRFRGDRNVTWMDTLNRVYAGAGRTSDYVIAGVGMYGIDAYYNYPGDTFDSVVGKTLKQIRALTNKPVLINETGIGQVNDQARDIPGLVKGVADNHLAGLVYFNKDQGTSSPYQQNWALTPAGMKALRDSLAGAG